MKKIFTLAISFATAFTSFTQSLGYKDLGVLFSGNGHNGSARFTAMSGAFGAIGGDISAVNINPAGIAVFNNSQFSATFNSRNTAIAARYYGTDKTIKEDYINFSNAGAVLVFNSAYNSGWTKFAFGVNYRIKKDFNDSFLASGNSEIPTFRDFPLDQNDPAIDYNISDQQVFSNFYDGEITEFNFAFSAVHEEKLYVGASLNTYSLDFIQRSNLTEFNQDGNGNTLDANIYQQNNTSGAGLSLSTGFIYKLNQYFRFGLSYQTPTWFREILEETNILDNEGYFGDTEISVSEDPNSVYSNTAGNYFPINSFRYKLKTPSKITASAAVVFGDKGLISIDYTNKNYDNIKLSNALDFQDENQFFQNNLRNTHALNLGTEWRMDRFSIRGGYLYEQSPDKNAIDSDNLEGYSFGGGYNFGNFKIDFAYSNNNRTGLYPFYSQFNEINAAGLTIDNQTFTATLSINL